MQSFTILIAALLSLSLQGNALPTNNARDLINLDLSPSVNPSINLLDDECIGISVCDPINVDGTQTNSN
jgi:hypothetical protein